ncbi:5-methyltetrahydropteroyltriglutamate--homocysteine S-methyltransferase, partial [Klebsiella pneumoniae]|nr:5-methyltetrahydropteroyltriglutamate--homocysteine S-methyltransferase [Klebsiella pneumoniae]
MTTSRFQLVGSLLRPANLGEFKRQIEAREDIKYPFYDDFDGYKETEASLIQKIVAEQKENGLDIVTDGEFGRSMWHLDFLWGFDGI